jgi:hypothetical protein
MQGVATTGKVTRNGFEIECNSVKGTANVILNFQEQQALIQRNHSLLSYHDNVRKNIEIPQQIHLGWHFINIEPSSIIIIQHGFTFYH